MNPLARSLRAPARPLLVAALLAAADCQTESPAPNTAAYAPPPGGSSGATPAAAQPAASGGASGGGSIILNGNDPGGAGGGTCTAQLVVSNIQRRAGCTIDERVSRQPGVLTYPCVGGPAEARFGETRFAGEVRGGNVTVEIETRFPFSDGCQWSSKQRIVGALGTRALAYEYLEAPLDGQHGCAPACSASGAVQVQ